MRVVFLFLAAVLFGASLSSAQPPLNDSIFKAFVQAELAAQKLKIDAQATVIKTLDDSLKKDVTEKPENSAANSFFKAWEFSKKNPLSLYCDAAKAALKDCKICKASNSFNIIKLVTWILLIIILFLAFKYFIQTALCRDESYIKGANGEFTLRPEKERPYSYSRTQLFWWSMIIFTCYTIFFALYGTLLPLNPTTVLLMGGGLATQLLGKAIDKTQIDNTVTGKGESAIPNPSRHQDISTTKGLLIDILSDENGVSIHRLQSVMFNLVYGLAFIGFFIKAAGNCAYPLIDFEEWQLTLLGMSGAGYLGMKTTENSKKTEPARIAQAEEEANAGNENPTPERSKDNYQ